MTAPTVLRNPLITEKATKLANKNTYALSVALNANKFQVAQAIEELYKVEVKHIRMLIRKGEVVRVGRKRTEKKRPDRKIAYITLRKGELDVIPNA